MRRGDAKRGEAGGGTPYLCIVESSKRIPRAIWLIIRFACGSHDSPFPMAYGESVPIPGGMHHMQRLFSRLPRIHFG